MSIVKLSEGKRRVNVCEACASFSLVGNAAFGPNIHLCFYLLWMSVSYFNFLVQLCILFISHFCNRRQDWIRVPALSSAFMIKSYILSSAKIRSFVLNAKKKQKNVSLSIHLQRLFLKTIRPVQMKIRLHCQFLKFVDARLLITFVCDFVYFAFILTFFERLENAIKSVWVDRNCSYAEPGERRKSGIKIQNVNFFYQ